MAQEVVLEEQTVYVFSDFQSFCDKAEEIKSKSMSNVIKTSSGMMKSMMDRHKGMIYLRHSGTSLSWGVIGNTELPAFVKKEENVVLDRKSNIALIKSL